jgi:hypothetical protein
MSLGVNKAEFLVLGAKYTFTKSARAKTIAALI